MSTIQYGWHRSQFVTPKPNEIVWVVDDEKEVRLVVYESMCRDGTPWRVFGETTRLYGFRWWQRCADNMRPPPPEAPKEEVPAAPQEGVYGPGDPPDMAPSLPAGCQGDPDPADAKLERDKAGTPNPCGCEVWQICPACNPSEYYGDLGASADDPSPAENPDRVNAPEPLGEPANIRTELAQLRADLMAVCKFLHDPDGLSVVTTMEKINSALKVVSKHVLALDSHQKQVDARLDEIEKHTDFSHNSK